MNTYNAYYRGRQIEVKADTSLAAQTKAAEQFKARKRWDVTVVLVALADGKAIEHKPQDICP